jgi:hypothetical protein
LFWMLAFQILLAGMFKRFKNNYVKSTELVIKPVSVSQHSGTQSHSLQDCVPETFKTFFTKDKIMQEIMILRDVGDRTQLQLFNVDDSTLSKLIRIRGTLYKDNPRLTLAKDLPEHKKPQPGAVISDEMLRRYDPKLRAEFGNSIGRYLAYLKAVESGRCRVCGVS